MKHSDWLRRIVQSLEFGAGFELFLLVGPGELANSALGRIAEELGRFGSPRWHHLDVEGFAGLLSGPERGVLHLVHGFERLPNREASELAARLNLNRDRMRSIAAPVFLWLPDDFYETFFRQAPDLFAWRSQVDVVSAADFESGPGSK